jgi:hypothetical protein
MSIAHHFERRRDAGFVRSYDLRAARRQFQTSLILILVMTAAAIALGLAMHLGSLGHHTVLRAGVAGGAET